MHQKRNASETETGQNWIGNEKLERHMMYTSNSFPFYIRNNLIWLVNSVLLPFSHLHAAQLQCFSYTFSSTHNWGTQKVLLKSGTYCLKEWRSTLNRRHELQGRCLSHWPKEVWKLNSPYNLIRFQASILTRDCNDRIIALFEFT